MPLNVEVQNGQVVSMTDVNGQPVPADLAGNFDKAATMERLFVIAAEALKTADQVQVKYDAKYGFPTSIQIDPIKQATDDEIAYTVSDFEIVP